MKYFKAPSKELKECLEWNKTLDYNGKIDENINPAAQMSVKEPPFIARH